MTNSSEQDSEIPSGFQLEHNIVPEETWQAIQHWLSTEMLPSSANDPANLTRVEIPYEIGSVDRRVAQFGSCKYDYDEDSVIFFDSIEYPIPTFIRETLLANEIGGDGEEYTQCIINIYEDENEIPWHVDHKYFGKKILVYTFGASRPLCLRRPISHKDGKSIEYGSIGLQCPQEEYTFQLTQAYPRHCSKYILEGPSRSDWEHSVPSGKGKRVSFTFRTWRGPT